jgi:hypothetical protein
MNIKEDKEKWVVRIDDVKFEGFVSGEKCPGCGQYRIYYSRYDSFFCPVCNAWSEKACNDKECEFCSRRPETPLR